MSAKKTGAPAAKGRQLPSPDRDARSKPVAQNRKARHDYDILETFECGIVLQGSEVKTLRAGRGQLRDSFARVDEGELWLIGANIPQYEWAHGFGAHDPERRRKLLVHRSQIDELTGKVDQKALTLVPLEIYFRHGKAKLTLALAKGRHAYDKRRALAERDSAREMARVMRGHYD